MYDHGIPLLEALQRLPAALVILKHGLKGLARCELHLPCQNLGPILEQ